MNDLPTQNYRLKEVAMPWRVASFDVTKHSIATVTQEATAAWAACGAFEWVALGYLAASSALIAAFAENLAHPLKLFSVQTLAVTLILSLCLLDARVAEQAKWRGEIYASRFWRFWRHWYPHL